MMIDPRQPRACAACVIFRAAPDSTWCPGCREAWLAGFRFRTGWR